MDGEIAVGKIHRGVEFIEGKISRRKNSYPCIVRCGGGKMPRWKIILGEILLSGAVLNFV